MTNKINDVLAFLLLLWVFKLIKETGYWEGWDAKTKSDATIKRLSEESTKRTSGNTTDQERSDGQPVHEIPKDPIF